MQPDSVGGASWRSSTFVTGRTAFAAACGGKQGQEGGEGTARLPSGETGATAPVGKGPTRRRRSWLGINDLAQPP